MTSSSLRQFNQLQNKTVIRDSLLKRPKSIQSLKKSLYINHSNVGDFVKYVKDPLIHHSSQRSKNQQADLNLIAQMGGLRNIVRNINAKEHKNSSIFLRKNSLKSKNFKKQLKLQRSILKFTTQNEAQEAISLGNSFYRTKAQTTFQKFNRKIAGNTFIHNNNKKYNKTPEDWKNTVSANSFLTSEQQLQTNRKNYWGKSHKKETKTKRWRTEGNEKPVDKSLGQMIQFCEKKNTKRVNYLVLQLQLNIQDSKRIWKKTRQQN